MVGSIANRAITDLIREGNVEGLRNFLESRKSHVDDKDEEVNYLFWFREWGVSTKSPCTSIFPSTAMITVISFLLFHQSS